MDEGTKNFIGLIMIIFLILFVWGYLLNIGKLVTSDFKAPYAPEALRVIGIPIVPIGAILGYVNMEDD